MIPSLETAYLSWQYALGVKHTYAALIADGVVAGSGVPRLYLEQYEDACTRERAARATLDAAQAEAEVAQ